jgi:hypothetical protein
MRLVLNLNSSVTSSVRIELAAFLLPLHPVNVAYHAENFASLALEIATEAKNQDAIDHWSRRAVGNVRVVSLHP